MLEMSIYSWNSEGAFEKHGEKLDGYLDDSTYNVLLIQETGTPTTTGYAEGEVFTIGGTDYKCILAIPDPTAKVERCTTAIMLDLALMKAFEKADYEYQQVSRPLCYVDFKFGLRIATIHATAWSDTTVGEVKEHIEWLNDDEEYQQWILMGDFNSHPISYMACPRVFKTNQECVSGYPVGAGGYRFFNVIADNEPTQGDKGNRTNYLDFAFTSEPHEFVVNGISNSQIIADGRYWSDHNLICLSVDI